MPRISKVDSHIKSILEQKKQTGCGKVGLTGSQINYLFSNIVKFRTGTEAVESHRCAFTILIKGNANNGLVYRACLSKDSHRVSAHVSGGSHTCKELFSNSLNNAILKRGVRQTPAVALDKIGIGVPLCLGKITPAKAELTKNNYKNSIKVLNIIEKHLKVDKSKLDLFDKDNIVLLEGQSYLSGDTKAAINSSGAYLGVYCPSSFWLTTSYTLSIYLSLIRLLLAGNYKGIKTYAGFKRKALALYRALENKSVKYVAGNDKFFLKSTPDWLLFMENAPQIFTDKQFKTHETMTSKFYSGSFGILAFLSSIRQKVGQMVFDEMNPGHALVDQQRNMTTDVAAAASRRMKKLGFEYVSDFNRISYLNVTENSHAVNELVNILSKKE